MRKTIYRSEYERSLDFTGSSWDRARYSLAWERDRGASSSYSMFYAVSAAFLLGRASAESIFSHNMMVVSGS